MVGKLAFGVLVDLLLIAPESLPDRRDPSRRALSPSPDESTTAMQSAGQTIPCHLARLNKTALPIAGRRCCCQCGDTGESASGICGAALTS